MQIKLTRTYSLPLLFISEPKLCGLFFFFYPSLLSVGTFGILLSPANSKSVRISFIKNIIKRFSDVNVFSVISLFLLVFLFVIRYLCQRIILFFCWIDIPNINSQKAISTECENHEISRWHNQECHVNGKVIKSKWIFLNGKTHLYI